MSMSSYFVGCIEGNQAAIPLASKHLSSRVIFKVEYRYIDRIIFVEGNHL